MYDQVTGQFSRYLGHVSKYIGGQMETPKTIEQSGSVYEVVAKNDQKRALEFLSQNIFITPDWLLKKEVFQNTGKTPITVIENLQTTVLNRILSANVLQLMNQSQTMDSNAYALVDYMNDLKGSIFNNSTEDIYRRSLQRNYVESLITLLNAKPAAPNSFSRMAAVSQNSDVTAIVRGTLNSIKENIAIKTSGDLVNKYHYEDLTFRIQKALDPK